MFPWNGLRNLGDSGNGGTTLEFLSPFLWRAPPHEMGRERQEFFPDQQRKEPVSRARRRKRSSSGCGRNSRASSRVESVPEPEDSSPVLTWILGYFWSLPRGVSPRLEWGYARALSSGAVAAVSHFHSRGSRYLCISLKAFPRGFPTRLSLRAVPRATLV